MFGFDSFVLDAIFSIDAFILGSIFTFAIYIYLSLDLRFSGTDNPKPFPDGFQGFGQDPTALTPQPEPVVRPATPDSNEGRPSLVSQGIEAGTNAHPLRERVYKVRTGRMVIKPDEYVPRFIREARPHHDLFQDLLQDPLRHSHQEFIDRVFRSRKFVFSAEDAEPPNPDLAEPELIECRENPNTRFPFPSSASSQQWRGGQVKLEEVRSQRAQEETAREEQSQPGETWAHGELREIDREYAIRLQREVDEEAQNEQRQLLPILALEQDTSPLPSVAENSEGPSQPATETLTQEVESLAPPEVHQLEQQPHPPAPVVVEDGLWQEPVETIAQVPLTREDRIVAPVENSIRSFEEERVINRKTNVPLIVYRHIDHSTIDDSNDNNDNNQDMDMKDARDNEDDQDTDLDNGNDGTMDIETFAPSNDTSIGNDVTVQPPATPPSFTHAGGYNGPVIPYIARDSALFDHMEDSIMSDAPPVILELDEAITADPAIGERYDPMDVIIDWKAIIKRELAEPLERLTIGEPWEVAPELASATFSFEEERMCPVDLWMQGFARTADLILMPRRRHAYTPEETARMMAQGLPALRDPAQPEAQQQPARVPEQSQPQRPLAPVSAPVPVSLPAPVPTLVQAAPPASSVPVPVRTQPQPRQLSLEPRTPRVAAPDPVPVQAPVREQLQPQPVSLEPRTPRVASSSAESVKGGSTGAPNNVPVAQPSTSSPATTTKTMVTAPAAAVPTSPPSTAARKRALQLMERQIQVALANDRDSSAVSITTGQTMLTGPAPRANLQESAAAAGPSTATTTVRPGPAAPSLDDPANRPGKTGLKIRLPNPARARPLPPVTSTSSTPATLKTTTTTTVATPMATAQPQPAPATTPVPVVPQIANSRDSTLMLPPPRPASTSGQPRTATPTAAPGAPVPASRAVNPQTPRGIPSNRTFQTAAQAFSPAARANYSPRVSSPLATSSATPPARSPTPIPSTSQTAVATTGQTSRVAQGSGLEPTAAPRAGPALLTTLRAEPTPSAAPRVGPAPSSAPSRAEPAATATPRAEPAPTSAPNASPALSAPLTSGAVATVASRAQGSVASAASDQINQPNSEPSSIQATPGRLLLSSTRPAAPPVTAPPQTAASAPAPVPAPTPTSARETDSEPEKDPTVGTSPIKRQDTTPRRPLTPRPKIGNSPEERTARCFAGARAKKATQMRQAASPSTSTQVSSTVTATTPTQQLTITPLRPAAMEILSAEESRSLLPASSSPLGTQLEAGQISESSRVLSSVTSHRGGPADQIAQILGLEDNAALREDHENRFYVSRGWTIQNLEEMREELGESLERWYLPQWSSRSLPRPVPMYISDQLLFDLIGTYGRTIRSLMARGRANHSDYPAFAQYLDFVDYMLTQYRNRYLPDDTSGDRKNLRDSDDESDNKNQPDPSRRIRTRRR